MDTMAELSSHLGTAAASLMKIANDIRWMNSGPIGCLGEIVLPKLQPGSSIMPGKVNPVICEATLMACDEVIGNDVAVAIGNRSGNFELNVMMPLIAHNVLQSIAILGNDARVFGDKVIEGFAVNEEHLAKIVERSLLSLIETVERTV